MKTPGIFVMYLIKFTCFITGRIVYINTCIRDMRYVHLHVSKEMKTHEHTRSLSTHVHWVNYDNLQQLHSVIML